MLSMTLTLGIWHLTCNITKHGTRHKLLLWSLQSWLECPQYESTHSHNDLMLVGICELQAIYCEEKLWALFAVHFLAKTDFCYKLYIKGSCRDVRRISHAHGHYVQYNYTHQQIRSIRCNAFSKWPSMETTLQMNRTFPYLKIPYNCNIQMYLVHQRWPVDKCHWKMLEVYM